MGDFIILNIGNSSKYTTSCRFSVKYLYEEFQKGSWEMVYRIIEENILQAGYHEMNERN